MCLIVFAGWCECALRTSVKLKHHVTLKINGSFFQIMKPFFLDLSPNLLFCQRLTIHRCPSVLMSYLSILLKVLLLTQRRRIQAQLSTPWTVMLVWVRSLIILTSVVLLIRGRCRWYTIRLLFLIIRRLFCASSFQYQLILNGIISFFIQLFNS